MSRVTQWETAAKFVAAVGLIAVCGTASAIPIASAVIDGPDNSTTINIRIFNDAASTSDIVSILLDGSAGMGFPVLWDDLGTINGPAGATVATAGVDTQMVTLSFTDNPDGFNPGEQIDLLGVDVDGDPGPADPSVQQLVGVRVHITFEDGTTLWGDFVDVRDGGLVAEFRPVVVPEPATIGLFGIGLLGVALRARRRMHV